MMKESTSMNLETHILTVRSINSNSGKSYAIYYGIMPLLLPKKEREKYLDGITQKFGGERKNILTKIIGSRVLWMLVLFDSQSLPNYDLMTFSLNLLNSEIGLRVKEQNPI